MSAANSKMVQVNSASHVNIFRSYADVVNKSTLVLEVEGEVDPALVVSNEYMVQSCKSGIYI